MNNKITITEAMKQWNEKYPDKPVSRQTFIIWSKKFLGKKENDFLLRSKILIDIDKFNEFLNNPLKFLMNDNNKTEE